MGTCDKRGNKVVPRLFNIKHQFGKNMLEFFDESATILGKIGNYLFDRADNSGLELKVPGCE
jgi:hypothetical protein